MAKGIKEHSEKIEILKFLGVVALIDPLETQSAAAKRNGDDVELVRPAYGSVYSQYGVELVKLLAESDLEESHRAQAEQMLNDSLPLLIRFLTDRQIETSNSVFPYLSDLLKSVSLRPLRVKADCPSTKSTTESSQLLPTLLLHRSFPLLHLPFPCLTINVASCSP